MPELPEVERAAAALRAAIGGKVIARVRVFHPALRRRVAPRTLRALAGAVVERVERRGKHQLVHLADGRVIHVHFRMNGDWIIDRREDALPRFGRAAIDFDDDSRVVLEDSRMLSTLDVHAAGAMPDLQLGPEPQDPALTPELLHAALARRGIALKVALLDQSVIAGLGNIYAAEALWRARLDPRMPANAVTLAETKRLLAAMRYVIARATGTRYRDDDVTSLDVYDRGGLPCRRCRTPIERITQAARSTWFCPQCQTAKKTGGAQKIRTARGRRASKKRVSPSPRAPRS